MSMALHLSREVLSPREALCDGCLAFDRRRRWGSSLARAIGMFVIVVVLVHLLEVL
jgi:hypothetical protein